MIRVRVWQTTDAAEWFFRGALPLPLLDPTRFEVTYGPPGPDMHDFDVVFTHRLAGHQPLWLALCADPNVLTVYDMDDDILNVDPENTVPYALFHPQKAGTRASVEAAGIVTVSSPAMGERYRVINPAVSYLPICIPDDMPDWPLTPDPHPTVGWAGSHFKAQDWAPDDVAGKLAEYAERVPAARFSMAGADYTRGLLGDRMTFTPFGTVADYYRRLNFTVGLAPMMDSPFNVTKTATKLIEYGARGIPTIASAIGQYPEWIEDGINGLLVRTPADWVEHLMTLTDPNVRDAMGAAAHTTARNWTIGMHLWRWAATFEGNPVP